LVLEARGRLRRVGLMIYIPMVLARDSQFPFREGQELVLRIDVERRRLVVEAAPRQEGDEEG